jgi:hypothetical protein
LAGSLNCAHFRQIKVILPDADALNCVLDFLQQSRITCADCDIGFEPGNFDRDVLGHEERIDGDQGSLHFQSTMDKAAGSERI